MHMFHVGFSWGGRPDSLLAPGAALGACHCCNAMPLAVVRVKRFVRFGVRTAVLSRGPSEICSRHETEPLAAAANASLCQPLQQGAVHPAVLLDSLLVGSSGVRGHAQRSTATANTTDNHKHLRRSANSSRHECFHRSRH